ncbi:MAG: hypothetical protein WDN24_12715 [Sphingomonas sp.]
MAIESVSFELVPDWEKCPPGDEYSHQDVAAVACDSHDRVYLHTRKGDRVMVYEEDGTFIRKWGRRRLQPRPRHDHPRRSLLFAPTTWTA